MMCLCAGATVMKSVLLAIIFALPFLGIGLKFKTFNDSSLEENGEIVYDAGYEPNYYWPVLSICCYLGYTQGLYETSPINIAGLLISTTACFIWLIYPNKINKYLPFENRTKRRSNIFSNIINHILHTTPPIYYNPIYRNFRNYQIKRITINQQIMIKI